MSEPRTIDGRTLFVLARWAQAILNNADADTYTVMELTVTASDYRELQSAVDNVKYAMENVVFQVPSDG